MDLCALTAHELQALLEKGEVSSRQVTEALLARVEELDGKIRAYITVTPEWALEAARAADEARARGEHTTPLCGIPVALKDNLCTKGVRTTCASRILEDFIPPYDAAVVEKVRASRMPVLGKTNLDEFAMGSSTENSAFFPTRNPWDLDRVPGGSSGGSAAAVAADETIVALGSDTGGSIRQPAALCGVVGLKPTYGRVSRYGLVAFASSLDQIGPITKDVTDAALVLNLVAGHDRRDSTSAEVEVPDYTAYLRPEVQGLRLGIPREFFVTGIDPQVKAAVERAIRILEGLGAEVVEVSLPHTEYALATYYLIAPAEASSNLARYDGVRYGYRSPGAPDVVTMFKETRSRGFGPEVKRRIMLGTYALSAGYYDAYYRKAQQVRTLIRQDFERAFEQCDVIVSSTSPTAAFRLGEKVGDPLAMYLSDLFTIPPNIAALPALSVPCGYTSEGLPVGLQLIGRHFEEGTLLQVGFTLEQALAGERRRPPLAAGGKSDRERAEKGGA